MSNNVLSPPRITFAIPYYRGLDYLSDALRSLLRQENPNWKAVVLDDRGGEDAESLVLSLSDSRFTFVRNEINLGLARNWNRAVSLVDTEFLTIFHSDDELEPNYTDVMISLLERHPHAAAGHCRTRIIGTNGKAVWSFPDLVKTFIRPSSSEDTVLSGQQGLLSITRGAWIFCPTMCYRTALFPSGGFDPVWKFALDVDLMSKIFFDGGTIVGTSTVAYRYRRHRQNQTAILTESNLRFREELRHLDNVARRAEQLGWSGVSRSARRKTVVRLHLLYQALRAVARLKFTRAWPLMLGSLRGQLK